MFERITTSIPNTVVIVGCGGTGSRLVPLVAQFLKSLPYVLSPRMLLMDFDVVEEKNLIRQNFIRPDVGRNKAVVLAERYSRAFDIDIVAYTEPMPKVYDLYSPLTRVMGGNHPLPNNAIIALCVDSAQARRNVLESFTTLNKGYNPFYLDSGNEDGFGQVMLFNSEYMVDGSGLEEMAKTLPAFIPSKSKLASIPCDMKFYTELKDVSAGSCADLDQTLAINCLMATTMMGVIQNHYYSKPMNYNRINVTLEGCTYSNILSVKNFSKLSIGATKPVQTRSAEETFAVKCGFKQSRLDDHLYNLYNIILADQKAAEKLVSDKKKALAKTKAEEALKEAMRVTS